jgi:hypothetical protein
MSMMLWRSSCHQITPAGVLLARKKWRESLKTPIHAPLCLISYLSLSNAALQSSSSSAE